MTMMVEPEALPGADLRSAARDRQLQKISLISAVVITLAIVSPPADELVDRSFSMHMIQHMIMIVIVSPLLAFSWPFMFGRWSESGFVAMMEQLARPLPALMLSISTATFWFWHIPEIYDLALEDAIVHTLEHLVFIVGFMFFWRPLMSSSDHLATNGLRVLYLTIGMVANGLLGAYLTFADHLIYPHYAESTPAGRTALADQQLGGAIMLIVGSIAMGIAAIVTMRDE